MFGIDIDIKKCVCDTNDKCIMKKSRVPLCEFKQIIFN